MTQTPQQPPAAVCNCPDGCALCAQPTGQTHDPDCDWRRPHLPHQLPRADAVVRRDQTHRPGCPHTRRHPGPLFGPVPGGREQCGYCGAVDTCVREQWPSFGGTVEGTQTCTRCGSQWGWADLSAIV